MYNSNYPLFPPICRELVAWFAADQIFGKNSTLPADDAAISLIVDSSGNNNNLTQVVAADKPIFKTNIINSKPVFRFTSLDSIGITNSPALQNTGGATIFAVAKSSTLASFSTICNVSINGTSATRAGMFRDNTNFNVGGRRIDGGAYHSVVSGTVGTSVFTYDTGILDYANSNAFVYSNGVLLNSNLNFQTDGNTANTTSNFLTIGGNLSGLESLIGDIAEVLVYRKAFTTASERVAIETYLKNKYAL